MIHGDGSARPLAALVELAREAIAPEEIAQDAMYIGLEDIAGESGAITTRTVDAGELKSGKFSFTNRHLLYGKLRPNLRKVARPNFSGICSTDILPLLPRDGVDRGYLFHWLRQPSVVAAVSSQATGMNLPRISPKRLLELQVPLPPLDEQRRIATLLDRADSVRRKREKSRGLVDDLLRSVFLEMFGDPVVNQQRWPTVPLEGVADIASGVTIGRKLREGVSSLVNYLRVANVQDGFLKLDDIKQTSATRDEIARYALKPGDILLTEGGDPDKLGRGAIWDGGMGECIHQNHIFRVRARQQEFTPEYLSALLSSSYGKRYFLRAAKQTTGIASINRTQLGGFPVLVTPFELQERFAVAKQKTADLAVRVDRSEVEMAGWLRGLGAQLLGS